MFRFLKYNRQCTEINIDEVQKATVSEVKEFRQAGTYGRTITIWTTEGDIYCIQLEGGTPEALTLKDPEPDGVRLEDS
jgi:hypothetical protein